MVNSHLLYHWAIEDVYSTFFSCDPILWKTTVLLIFVFLLPKNRYFPCISQGILVLFLIPCKRRHTKGCALVFARSIFSLAFSVPSLYSHRKKLLLSMRWFLQGWYLFVGSCTTLFYYVKQGLLKSSILKARLCFGFCTCPFFVLRSKT